MTGRTALPDLLTALAAEGRPRLTWYGEERIELSGAVLVNWVTKTTNLLVEEYDVGPGSRVLLDLPPHWRTVVWALATWRAGGAVDLPRGTGPVAADVVVSDSPERHASAPDLVAVALPALARSFDGPLPPGATDAAGAVMTYGDALGPVRPAAPEDPALHGPDGPVAHGGLLGWARERLGDVDAPWVRPVLEGEPVRALVEPHDDDVASLLALSLALLSADGSVVLCAPDVARELATDPGRRHHLLESERATG